ncbi:MAG: DNA translocase FtsK [Dysgonamonadaceae bacterium]|jgi:S-DNA-T family DNA segregation ATPase FtsK/SpoIIIE|nr:DNA translocase FtsK [Dysgonamonadaceae bacterium]
MFKKKIRKKHEAEDKRKQVAGKGLGNNRLQFITGLIITMFSLYAIIAVISAVFAGDADQSVVENSGKFASGKETDPTGNMAGLLGARLGGILINDTFGIPSVFMLVFLTFAGLRMMKAVNVNLSKMFIIFTLLTVWTSTALQFFLGSLFTSTTFHIGGKHGLAISDFLYGNVGKIGEFMIILLVFIFIMSFITDRTVPFIQKMLRKRIKVKIPAFPEKNIKNIINKKEDEDHSNNNEYDNERKEKEIIITADDDDDFPINIPGHDVEKDSYKPQIIETPHKKPDTEEHFISGEDEKDAAELLKELGPYDPRADLSHYQYPKLEFLKTYTQKISPEEIREETKNNKKRIVDTLKTFDIEINEIKATVGPTVTLYEITLAPGIRISKVRNLEDDIAMSLAALGIRIIAPMPGKGTIGIEVPNNEPQTVSMQSILNSEKFQKTKFELPIALGKTITDEVFMVDLIKMPHLLVAGATGQGKSVGLNAAITSLLYKKHPAELKFVLVDPKMVEFSLYSVIEKHFLAKLPDSDKPIITDFTKVIYTLNSLCIEMDDRYKLLEQAGSRNVQEYNEKFINRRLNPMKGHRFMPYIVVVIDEFGDLIMTAGKEIEQPIARIAQKARAVGMHMIIATQRPTTNIITGTIKANFPARIAFRVITAVDSRTILDSTGANQLIGRGDMLFFQGSDKIRIQCAFVDTPEVERIVKFIGNQPGYPEALELPEYVGDNSDGVAKEQVTLDKLDPLFKEAANLIVTHQQGSTSLVQRKLSIGFARSGRLVDQLELAGIVGKAQGSKAREVLIADRLALEYKLKELGI